jgi:hypothetical protein
MQASLHFLKYGVRQMQLDSSRLDGIVIHEARPTTFTQKVAEIQPTTAISDFEHSKALIQPITTGSIPASRSAISEGMKLSGPVRSPGPQLVN